MQLRLGRIPARCDDPPVRKFARPLVLIPELFTTHSHLSLLAGYLVSIGWKVYTIDLYGGGDTDSASFERLIELANDAMGAAGDGAIAVGHGLGGLIALKLAELPGVGAGVAFAPLPPGFASPLFASWRNRAAARMGWRLSPPAGRILFEFVADADAFLRAAIIKDLRPAPSIAIVEVAQGPLTLAPTSENPRLIVTGNADIFAPHDRVAGLAEQLGTELATLEGRGHWLIGGRALERAVGETQRFLIKRHGQELLLLYPAEAE
jgi:pimeloyl-ACP methyl ester carboxylesterase